MQKAISTQEEVTALKNALELLARNLAFHVNQALGKAHGIELFMGYVDASGNDLRIYYDSMGAAISGTNTALPNFIRWTIDGVMYYTPLEYSDPGAQAPTTGAIPSPTVITPAEGPAGTSLITDYVSYETPAAEGMNDYVLAHSKLTHQVAHTATVPMSAFHSPVYSPSGAVLGEYRIRMAWHNYVWEFPATTRLGGPIQPMRVTTGYSPNYIHSEGYHGTGTPNPDTACPGPVVGTKPWHLVMEYWNGSGWTNMLPGHPPNVVTNVPAGVYNGHGPIPIQWSDTTGCVQVFSMSQGNDDFSYARLRLSVYQDATATTTVIGQLDIRMEEKDPGACFFFKTALDFQIPDFLVYDAKREFYSDRCRRGYKWMTHWGVPLMEDSKAFFKVIRYGIVQPFLWWGAFRYRRLNKWGWLCSAYCRAWLWFWRIVGTFVKEPSNPPGWKDKPLQVIPTKAQAEPRSD